MTAIQISSWMGIPMRALLLGLLGMGGTKLLAHGHSHNPTQPEATRPILALKVRSFIVKHTDMEGALRTLRAEDVSRIVIGFERVPHREGEEGKRISLELTNTTVGEIVRRLCDADPRYEYDGVQGRLIEVRPKRKRINNADLLNTRVREYSIDRHELPAGAIEAIAQDARELRELLALKESEWSKKTGIYPGSAGSIASGNTPPPRLRMHLENVSIREILNAIALQSLTMYRQGKVFGPVGWEYDFVVNPSANTGLGGYPKWKAF